MKCHDITSNYYQKSFLYILMYSSILYSFSNIFFFLSYFLITFYSNLISCNSSISWISLFYVTNIRYLIMIVEISRKLLENCTIISYVDILICYMLHITCYMLHVTCYTWWIHKTIIFHLLSCCKLLLQTLLKSHINCMIII